MSRNQSSMRPNLWRALRTLFLLVPVDGISACENVVERFQLEGLADFDLATPIEDTRAKCGNKLRSRTVAMCWYLTSRTDIESET